jgi:hypothetical protein
VLLCAEYGGANIAPLQRDEKMQMSACECRKMQAVARHQTKKNAAEAALKIWRHPSMKESLLASGSITGMPQLIHNKICN